MRSCKPVVSSYLVVCEQQHNPTTEHNHQNNVLIIAVSVVCTVIVVVVGIIGLCFNAFLQVKHKKIMYGENFTGVCESSMNNVGKNGVKENPNLNHQIDGVKKLLIESKDKVLLHTNHIF